jgi:hypothetical protein
METSLYSRAAYTKKDLGLQKRMSYDDMIRYLEKDPDKIKYPNRKATILRNSFELSQLDGLGQLEINRQHELVMRHQQRQILLARFAEDHGLPLADVRAYIENLGLHPLHEHELEQLPLAPQQGIYTAPAPVAEPLEIEGTGGGNPALQPYQPAAAQGVGGQLGPVQEPAAPAPPQLANRGGVVELAPPPLHARARAGNGEGIQAAQEASRVAPRFQVIRGADLALILRRNIFPELPPNHAPNVQRDQLVFIPNHIVRGLARAVIQAPREAEVNRMQVLALSEAIRVEEHRAAEVGRAANAAAQDLNQGRRVNVRALLQGGMNADQALNMLLQAGGHRGEAVEVPDGNQLALAPAPVPVEQPLVLRVNGGAGERDVLVRRRMVRKQPPPAAYRRTIPRGTVRVRGKQNHPDYSLA